MKNVCQKTFEISSVTLQEKKSNCFSSWWNGCWLFFSFFIVSIVQNRVIRLSKGLLRETYSIKEFTFEPKLSIKALNWRLNYTWQGKNTLFILLKYWMVFCIVSKNWNTFAFCQKNWNIFSTLKKKLNQFLHFIENKETLFASCQKKKKHYLHPVKKNWKLFRILSKKFKHFLHIVEKLKHFLRFVEKKIFFASCQKKHYSHPVKQFKNCYAFCRKK